MTETTARWRARTVWVLTAGAALLLGYDLLAYRLGGQDATVTQVLRDNSADWLLIPLLVGLALGHVFWGGGANK